MRKSLIAIGVTWIVGSIWKFYVGDYVSEPNLFYQILFVVAGGAALMLWVLPIPLFVALIQRYRTKKFPHSLFAKITFSILIFFAIFLFVGTYNMKNSGL